MPSIRKKTNRAGDAVYEIRVSRGRGKSYLTKRWEPPEGWSQKAIDRELAKVAAEFERQCHAGEVLSRSEMAAIEAQRAAEDAKISTLKQYGERVFMPAKTITVSENTRSYYQTQLDTHIYPVLGDMKLPEITPAQITALLLERQNAGAAHSSLIAIYTTLHQLFKSAYLDDTISHNPMDKVERPRETKAKLKDEEIDACTADELRYIISCLDREPLKWQAMIRLLIDTGVRRGEACALQWKNVDFKENRIAFADNLCYTKHKGVYIDTPKNGRNRTMDIAPEVMELLRRLQIEQSGKALSPFVFSQERSAKPMHPQSPTRYLKRFAERYGIEGLHPHKLRHSFASVAIINGADIASVSEKLGHSDKAVTLRMYTHADKESIKRAGDIFREAIKQPKSRVD